MVLCDIFVYFQYGDLLLSSGSSSKSGPVAKSSGDKGKKVCRVILKRGFYRYENFYLFFLASCELGQ